MKKKDIENILEQTPDIGKSKLYGLTNEWLGEYGQRTKYWTSKNKKQELKKLHEQEHKMRLAKKKGK